MCKRHCITPFKFFCITDNPNDINPEISIIPIKDYNLTGWWYKLLVFNKELNLSGTVLFLDLDLIVYDSIDKLWEYNPSDFLIIRDFTRHMNAGWKKFNSSVFRFNSEDYFWIWDEFYKNHKNIISKNHGDQDHLFSVLKHKAVYWPDDWIQSYKWEMRDKSDIQFVNGRRNFVNTKDPILKDNCCIAVFHGEPNPHDVKDLWVIENWK